MNELGAVLKQLVQERQRLQNEIDQLDQAITALQRVKGNDRATRTQARGTRKMSEAARKRISDAQKARWDKFRSGKIGKRRKAA